MTSREREPTFQEVNAAALAAYPRLLDRWFPKGHLQGREFRVGNLQGDAGHSLSVNVFSGVWTDFAAKHGGSDPISLYAALHELGQVEAKNALAEELGLCVPETGSRPQKHQTAKPRSNGQFQGEPSSPPPNSHPKLGEPALIHEYTDAAGRLLLHQYRFDLGGGKKTYRPLSRQNGAWVWKDPPGPLPLYGLADLAAHLDKPVLLVEGEKTAEVAREILDDFVVITWPHGAKAIGKVDWSPLAGRDVVAWPDADADGGGRKAMESAAQLITKAGAAKVAIVALPDELPDSWDLGDPLPEGWVEDTLRERIAAAEAVRAARAERPDISKADALRWVGKEPEPLEFVIAGLVPKRMVTLLIADGGAGKSLQAQTMMTCVVLGRPYLDRATMIGAAAGIFAEDPENVLHLRQRRINSVFDTTMENLVGNHFAESYLGFDAVLWRDWKTTDLFSDIEKQLASIPDLRLVEIDNAALVYAGNENDRMEVTQFIGALSGLALRLNVAIVLTFHTSKSSDRSVARAASGSTAWIWACRSVLKLEQAEEENETTLTLIKANHAKPGESIPLVWHEGVLIKKPDPSSFDERIRKQRLDRFMFERIRQAWDADWPLSPNPQAGDRYLPKVLAGTGEFSAKEAKVAMQGHIEAGNLKPDRKNARSPMGLRVVKDPF